MWIGLEQQGNAACFLCTGLWGVHGTAAKTGHVCLRHNSPKLTSEQVRWKKKRHVYASPHNSSRHFLCFSPSASTFLASWKESDKKALLPRGRSCECVWAWRWNTVSPPHNPVIRCTLVISVKLRLLASERLCLSNGLAGTFQGEENPPMSTFWARLWTHHVFLPET